MADKIILLTHEYPPIRGGAGVYCQELAMAAFELGAAIEVVAPKDSILYRGPKLRELSWKGSQGWVSSIRLLFYVRKFYNQKDKKFLLHVADMGICKAFIRFAFLLPPQNRIMVTIHGSELLKFTRNPIERFFFHRLLRKCEAIHVLSKFNYQKCSEFYPSSVPKLKLIPGAPSRVVDNCPQERQDKMDPEMIQILCVGRIHPRKGQALLLKAASMLPIALQSKIQIIFIGPVKDKRYQQGILSLSDKFNGRIQIMGDISESELRDFYENSDIFCLTPITLKDSVEGFGFVYLEASAYGLPIIATRVGGVEDAVLDLKTGLLSDPEKLDELKQNLLSLIKSKKLRKEMGAKGQKWSAQHTWAKIAIEIYPDIKAHLQKQDANG